MVVLRCKFNIIFSFNLAQLPLKNPVSISLPGCCVSRDVNLKHYSALSCDEELTCTEEKVLLALIALQEVSSFLAEVPHDSPGFSLWSFIFGIQPN